MAATGSLHGNLEVFDRSSLFFLSLVHNKKNCRQKITKTTSARNDGKIKSESPSVLSSQFLHVLARPFFLVPRLLLVSLLALGCRKRT